METIAKQSSTRRLTELHIIKARDLALRLLAVSSTRYPIEWADSLIVETVLMDLCEFAFHARRVADLCQIKDEDLQMVDSSCFDNLNGIIFQNHFSKALNSFHHVNDLTVGWSEWQGKKLYLDSPKELILYYIKVGGRHAGTISLYGVVFSYLNEVLLIVKKKFPLYQF